ncbi:hypothetical protein DIPPA_03685 [Diplonema papillatum]|nr:hypothetical protein DIPPA_03685 [Diplonema papillatum]
MVGRHVLANRGEVSTAELVIDFEIFTGVDLPGPLIATLNVSLLTRTKKMAKMLATLRARWWLPEAAR